MNWEVWDMNLKTSLFNKTIIKTDFKRYWWISALLMLLIAIFVLPNLIQETSYWNGNSIEYTKYYAVSDEGLLVWAAAFFTGVLLFSYLHRSNSVSAMHGIPVSRTAQFISHYFAGAVLIAIPAVITTVVMAIELKYYGLGIKYALQYAYTSGVYGFLMLSLSSFSAMIAGNIVAAYVFEFGFAILPFFFWGMLDYLFSVNLYGYVNNTYEFIEKIYITGVENMWSTDSLLLVAIAVVIFAVSFVLYKKRQLEYFDEIVVFKVLRYAFVIVVTCCFSMFSVYLFDQIYSITNIFTAIPLGIIALVATCMINKKAVSFKGTLKPAIIYVACVAICYCVFQFDLTGFEHRVPDADNVESISIENYGMYPYSKMNFDVTEDKINGIDYSDIASDALITSPEEIEKITNFHRSIVNLGKIENDPNPKNVYLEYNLKNGSKIIREYYISSDLSDEYYNTYVASEAYRKVNYPIINDNKKEVSTVTYTGMGISNLDISAVDKDALLQAVVTDIKNVPPKSIENRNYNNIRLINLTYNEIIEYNGKELVYPCRQQVNINDDFVNTLNIIDAEIQKSKYSDKIVKPEDVTSLSLDYSYNDEDGRYIAGDSTIEIGQNDAQEIFNSLYNIQPKNIYTDCYNIGFDFKSTKGEYFININYNYDSLPDVIKKYIKK